jgi:MFS family permease
VDHPLLKLSFTLFYVLLRICRRFRRFHAQGQGHVHLNLIKVAGCLLIFADVHPLLAYALVGFGAAVYSPAKYGILTELLPAEKLVAANGWVEGLTVLSIILGTVLGGALVGARCRASCCSTCP